MGGLYLLVYMYFSLPVSTSQLLENDIGKNMLLR